MGKPCVSGAGALRIDYASATLAVAGHVLRKGDTITIDGSTGQVLLGRVPMVEPQLSGEFATLMGWADEVRRLGVRANADTPGDARVALKFGAEGIGLCRTEHMFFDENRIRAVREMILADDERSRRVIRPSSASSTAILSAARAVRLPERVCSIQSLPRSTVNSRSCMSR